jgi:hypothetical protein
MHAKGDNERQQKKNLLGCLDEINSIEKDRTSVFIIGRCRFLKPACIHAFNWSFDCLLMKIEKRRECLV